MTKLSSASISDIIQFSPSKTHVPAARRLPTIYLYACLKRPCDHTGKARCRAKQCRDLHAVCTCSAHGAVRGEKSAVFIGPVRSGQISGAVTDGCRRPAADHGAASAVQRITRLYPLPTSTVQHTPLRSAVADHPGIVCSQR